jgi:hypothetical protein
VEHVEGRGGGRDRDGLRWRDMVGLFRNGNFPTDQTDSFALFSSFLMDC